MIFYESFYEAIKGLPDKERLAAYDAVIGYGITGIEPQVTGIPRIVYVMAKPLIDSNNLKSTAGKKGGRPRKSKDSEAEKPQAPEEKPLDFEETAETDAEKETESEPQETESEPKAEKQSKTKPIRHKYGMYKNVLLSDEELGKLQTEFPDWQKRIETLSAGIAQHGYKYSNFLAAIRNWAKKDAEKKETQIRGKPRPTGFSNFSPGGTDFDAIGNALLNRR